MSGRRCALLSIVLLACIVAVPARAQFPATGPILPMERQTIETPRTVAAFEYRDAYCAKWTDGCASCERASANHEPKCRAVGEAACDPKPVQCQALLKTATRVCLGYTDGCNTCVLGICTLVACPVKLPDGTTKLKDPAYQCYFPRRARYGDPRRLSSDLKGHWRLTDPRGRGCEIVNGFLVSLTPDCIVLGEPVTAIRNARVDGFTFQLTSRREEPLLSFDAANPDDLPGKDSSQGWRLTRLEATPHEPRNFEGAWVLRRDGFACNLFLTMRVRQIGPSARDDIVHVPHGVSLASNCLGPIYQVHIGIPAVDRTRPLPLLPQWTAWHTEGHQIVLRDEQGDATRFTPDHDGEWKAEIRPAGIQPIVVRLQRQPR